jgi:hypothetical protein
MLLRLHTGKTEILAFTQPLSSWERASLSGPPSQPHSVSVQGSHRPFRGVPSNLGSKLRSPAPWSCVCESRLLHRLIDNHLDLSRLILGGSLLHQATCFLILLLTAYEGPTVRECLPFLHPITMEHL